MIIPSKKNLGSQITTDTITNTGQSHYHSTDESDEAVDDYNLSDDQDLNEETRKVARVEIIMT